MSKLKEKLTDIECLLMGNRVTLAGRTLLASQTITLPLIFNNPTVLSSAGYTALSIGSALAWIAAEYQTDKGKTTFNVYSKTKNHLKQYGKIDERFAKRFFTENDNPIKNSQIDYPEIYGYCEWQGMYLASKALGKLDSFEELKDKYYKKSIPLF